MHVPTALVEKYAVQGPRYTSYPTAVEFTDAFTSRDWQSALRRDGEVSPDRSFSIYVHLPFCRSLCYFCACNKIITQEREKHVRPYLDTLSRELDLYQDLVGSDVPIQQIHWGGGTPNYLNSDEISWLQKEIVARFPNLVEDADVSVEIDPRTTEDGQVPAFRSAGFNRISMGVQDFDPQVQKLVNRIQPYEMTKRVCDIARAEGFSGINIDLIYGLPDQSVEGFCDTIEKVLEIRPERVALYGYAHVKWIQKVQKALERAHLPTPRGADRDF